MALRFCEGSPWYFRLVVVVVVVDVDRLLVVANVCGKSFRSSVTLFLFFVSLYNGVSGI